MSEEWGRDTTDLGQLLSKGGTMKTLNLLEVTWVGMLLTLLLFVITSVGGIALVSFLLVRLPAAYFCDDFPRDFWVERHPIIRWTGRVLKNVLGVAAVFLGVALSLPGIPGPGVLLILLGVTLVDFPGKRCLERWLVGRPKVLNTINRLRQQYGRPPLVLEGKERQCLLARPRSPRTLGECLWASGRGSDLLSSSC
jgi:hypothetical protein